MEKLTAQSVIDSSLIHEALKYYHENVAPIANQKTIEDLKRLISEHGTIAKTPLTYSASGQLEISSDDSEGGGQIVGLNNVKR